MLKFWNSLHRFCGRFEQKAVHVHLRTISKKRLWTKAIQPDLPVTRIPCVQSTKRLTDATSSLPPNVDSTTVVRKPVRRRRPLTSVYDSTYPRGPEIIGVAMAESFRLLDLLDDEHLFSLYNCTHIDEEIDDGLHFVPKPQYIIDQNVIKEFFLFADGVVVFWGINHIERSQIMDILSQYAELPFEASVVLEETDTLSFRMVKEGETRLKGEQLLLNFTNYLDGHFSSLATLERFAFSHGMAASVKVAIWEAQLLEYAEPLAKASKGLSVGKIPLKRKNVLMQTGTLLSLRHSINLNTNLIDSDFYWEKEDLEPYYRMALKHFAVASRRRMLNAQLDYCSEILKVVNGMQTHNCEARLEWMIIYLIVIEVLFAIIDHFGFNLGPPQKVLIDNCQELVNGINDVMQKRQ
ncbi:unnamed protein product [Litomosoides sigmodontis]|uniref:DUF155 domain-containing protein n=1 Tax=Litomosoides sigmodontis TaxID=42156 RepID=A0A3P6SFW4_LITSI|nr:unnamed protein product [Litomosoides sigmodontis]